MNPLKQVLRATKQVLNKSTNYKIAFVLITVLVFALYVLLPVWLTPGNTLEFQLTLIRPSDYVLFVVLAIATSILTLMQVYLFSTSRGTKSKAGAAGKGATGVFAAIFGGLLATAACSACIAAIIGFLGAGSVFFVLEYQMWITSLAFMLVAVGIYYSAKRINGYCGSCGTTCETCAVGGNHKHQ